MLRVRGRLLRAPGAPGAPTAAWGPGHHSTDPRTAENALTAPASRRGCARSGHDARWLVGWLEWGGGARTRDENFLRGGGAGWGKVFLCESRWGMEFQFC